MCRELEGNTSVNDVLSNWHDKAKVPMAASSACGWDGTHIGIDLLGQ